MVATNSNQETQPKERKNEKADQKTALLETLQKPMTGTDLLAAMCRKCPRVQLRDIWRLLKNLERREWVYCLTPDEVTGRLYFFTEKGRRVMRRDFNTQVKPLPPLVNWKKYAWVTRGQARKAVLLATGWFPPSQEKPEPKTISQIRKQLIQIHPLGLGGAIRAMHELADMKLVQRVGVTRKRGNALYLPTLAGRRIIEQSKELAARPEGTASESIGSNPFEKAAPPISNGKEEKEGQGF